MEWQKVTSIEQVKVGTRLKIIGNNPRDNYKWIHVKKLVNVINDVEVIINIKKNYYFNLTAFLEKRPMWGGWIKDLYFKENV